MLIAFLIFNFKKIQFSKQNSELPPPPLSGILHFKISSGSHIFHYHSFLKHFSPRSQKLSIVNFTIITITNGHDIRLKFPGRSCMVSVYHECVDHTYIANRDGGGEPLERGWSSPFGYWALLLLFHSLYYFTVSNRC